MVVVKLGDRVGNVEGVRQFNGEIVGVNYSEYAVRDNDTGEFMVYNSRELHWSATRALWEIS